MPSITYVYFPTTGALPGKSFEKQTTGFFDTLQEQVDTINTKVLQIEQDTSANIAVLREQITNIQSMLTNMQSAIVLAQNTADAAINIANNSAAGAVPVGGVVLMQGMVPTENWALADGNDGTVDLSGYTDSTDVVYMQRKADATE